VVDDGGNTRLRTPNKVEARTSAGRASRPATARAPLILAVLDHLGAQRPAVLWGVTAGSLGLIGALDFLTGAELSSTLFYLFPVGVASWCLGAARGRLVAVLSALMWQGSNLLAGETFSSPWIAVWNTLIRSGIFLVVASLLSEVHLLLEQRTLLSRQDALTGVLNKRAFYEAADVELMKLRRTGRPLTILFLGIDGFKNLNDTQGHLVGDMVLEHVAEQLKRQLRGSDVIGRMRGDEYAALLPELDPPSAHKVIGRLHEALAGEIRGREWPVTVSMGVLTCTGGAPAAEEMVDRADRLMYIAKHRGGDRVEYDSFPAGERTVRSAGRKYARYGRARA
jgi:diguanylate cyclase (GGDEF)-like protein